MMQLMFLVMGAFMDWVGIVLLAMPVFLPIVIALGFDPIWFGILFCVNMFTQNKIPNQIGSVSYTHLTLPTIYSV